jgi:hypothetical protein
VDSENGPNGGDDYGDQSTGGDDMAPPPLEIPPGSWQGYAAGRDANALTNAFNDGWNKRPQDHGNAPIDASIVVHGNNPITGYSVIMKKHGGGH